MKEHKQRVEAAERRLEEARRVIGAAETSLAEATRAVGAAIAQGENPAPARAAMREARERIEEQTAALPFLEGAVEAARVALRNAEEAAHRATLAAVGAEQVKLAEELELALDDLVALMQRSVRLQQDAQPAYEALRLLPYHGNDLGFTLGRWAGARLARVVQGVRPTDTSLSELSLVAVTRDRLEREVRA